MTTFICVLFQPSQKVPNWSGCYDASWVDKLYRGIQRNYSGPLDFLVLHDDKDYEFAEPVREEVLLDPEAGWACLMEAWRPDVAEDRVFVLGLDTIITGDITHIVNTETVLGLITDPYRTDTICNGVGLYCRAQADSFWDEWSNNRTHWENKSRYGGKISEMAFLRNFEKEALRLDRKYPGEILSYKAHVKSGLWRGDAARIIYFHGRPKPPNIPEQWILERWI